MRSAMLVLVMSGCAAQGVPSNATLADLPNLRLGVQGFIPSDTKPTNGSVFLDYDVATFRSTHGGECAALGGAFHGMLNNIEIAAGGGGDGGPDAIFGECAIPGLEFDVEFVGTTTIVAADDSLTVTAVLPADAFARHLPTLRSPSDWQFTGGEMVRIGWSQPDDLVGLTGPFQVAFYITDGNGVSVNNLDFAPQYVGDEIRLTIPAPTPVTGSGEIDFRFGYSNGVATTCTNATSCSYSATRGYAHQATMN
jgi:hypothetical protein